MITTKKDFEYFKLCCKKWLKRFEISDWDILYQHKKIDTRGLSKIISVHRVATVILSSDLGDDQNTKEQIELIAKHEVLHLLVAELAMCAKDRYIVQEQVDQAEEHLLAKLEMIIK